jgi:hypothetical protein
VSIRRAVQPVSPSLFLCVDELPVLLSYRDVDEYMTGARDTGGMFARIWNATSDEEHEAIEAVIVAGFVPFAVDGGYELPGVAVCAVAS